ncbi:uncharacterized protein LOC116187281 [Punica granatum]|uniref:Uncharacterized protein n=2 Tax=Punica granatum TaxID=22663 RepID=A0A218X9I5_PUNGR|nr:uncharacterized protein LOC116187281 [Punica granatum]OWM81554.1 hypothetical protein CDL15_Pgr007592 [Punica granatum]PKI41053.1 hypothetical protein CRG98_038581 [Punica granatum]
MEAVDGEVERLIATAKVVEYLEPVMSRDLLFKFPDNSAFGFDYSQSSIWSPLIPRAHVPMDSGGPVTPKKLSYGSGAKYKLRSAGKKIAASSFKLSIRVMQSNRKKKMKMKTNKKPKSKGLDFSPALMKGGACVPLAAKGWNKVLKAASKQFKKKRRRDPMAHVKLSNYLEADNI